MKKWRKKIIIAVGILIGIGLLTAIVLAVMASRFNGIWKMDAYGFCFDTKAGIAKAYIVTEKSYARMSQFDGIIINGTLYSGIGKFRLEHEKNELRLVDTGSQYVYTTKKQPKSYFDNLIHVTDGDQVAKLRMYYEILKENYAFADMYDVNFDVEFNKYASLVTSDTTDEQLYEYMCKMVEKLDDGHVEVDWNGKEYCPSDYLPEWFKGDNQAQQLVNVIKENYISNYYKFKNCDIRYATLREDIGYIVIQGFGTTDFNKAATTKKAMDRIINEFANKKTIVIDMRFSPGGFDEAALAIAGYFTTEEYLTYQKQAYNNGTFTEPQSIYVKPSKENYSGNVVILTSGRTISAAEIFIRNMLANPNEKVTIIGEKTAGYYSDAIPKKLTGGFEFTMSTERYIWYDGTVMEGKGIEPEVEIPFSSAALKEGKDLTLDWILENY